MGIVDVLIPGIAGLLLLIAPDLFIHRDTDDGVRIPRRKRFRQIGGLLCGVALLYALIVGLQK